MGKFATKRKAYFKKTQKIKQAKLNKEIAADEKFSSDEDALDEIAQQSDLEASDQESDQEPSSEASKPTADTDDINEVEIESDEEEQDVDVTREIENMPSLSKGRWKNKQRLLLIGSRGINTKTRHLIDDLSHLLPHAKKDVKVNKQQGFAQLNEIAEVKNCQNIIFFEARKKKDTFMWISPNTSEGPTVRFLVENVHTTSELKFAGNCLARSRPLLSFHEGFDASPELSLVKLCIQKTFNTPRYHPKSQPFVDHIFNFSIVDDKIWFRNYQIDSDSKDVIEIGPRMTLSPAAIFSKSFQGEKVWKSETFISPNERRRMARQVKLASKSNPVERMEGKIAREERLKGMEKYKLDNKDDIFK